MAKAKAKAKTKAAPVMEKTPEPVVVQVNPKYLRALRHIAAKNDIRYYLNGVYFHASKEGKFYVATDGHRIAIIHDKWGNGEEPRELALILPREVCAALKPHSKIPTALLKQVDSLTWTLDTHTGVVQQFKAIDGKYPEWQRVMPDAISGKPGSFNWRYLHEFDQCVKEAFGASFPVEVQHNGEGAAVLTSGTNDFLGLLMPMRHGYGPAMPQWAIAIQKEQVARKAKEKQEAEARQRAAQPEALAA